MRPPITNAPSAPDVTESPATLPVVRISDGLGVWCPDISEIQVGDHVRAIVRCQKQRLGSNVPNRQARNGTVKEIVGKIVRLECRMGSNVMCNLSDITKAWGHRKTPNAPS